MYAVRRGHHNRVVVRRDGLGIAQLPRSIPLPRETADVNATRIHTVNLRVVTVKQKPPVAKDNGVPNPAHQWCQDRRRGRGRCVELNPIDRR